MSEKFKKIVNAPHRAMGRLRQKVQYTRPESKGGRAVRVAGIGATGTFEFLLWAAKYLTLDNHAIRKMEQMLVNIQLERGRDAKNSKITIFMKKNPDLAAHMIYYLMAAAALGGVALTQTPVDTYQKLSVEKQDREQKAGTYAAFLDNMRPITPLLIADLIAKEGVNMKDGMHVPYLDSNGKPTIGFGSTVLKDGKRVTMNTPPITTEEAYELVRWHLEEETFFVMYCYDRSQQGVNINTTPEAFAIASIFYNAYANLVETSGRNTNYENRFALLRDDFKQYGFSMPDSLVVKRFKDYPITNKESFGEAWLSGADKKDVADKLGGFLLGGLGIRWRRWLEAGIMTGRVTPQMLLDCPVNGMYEFFCYIGKDKKNWFTKDAAGVHANTQNYDTLARWLKNPVNNLGQSLARWPRVRDILPADVVAMCESGKCEFGNKNFAHTTKAPETQCIEQKTYAIGYHDFYDAATAAYRSGDYAGAAAQFERLCADYPDNALVHNDLAATYNKLGRYDDAIAHVRAIVQRIGDKSQYGAAQYNAGYAYEKKGNLQKALANYKLARANGNRRAQADITRVTNMIRAAGKSKDNGRAVNKKTSFNQGIKKIENRAYTADFAFDKQNNGRA